MAELTIEIPGAVPTSASSAPAPSPPPAAAAPAAPAAGSTPERGPHNNWLQPVSYKEVTSRPANFDPSRGPTADAPHGFLTNGDPWSPYGTTELRGAIRRKPRPAQQGRDACAQAQAPEAPAGERRLAVSDLKPPANVAGLYAAIDDEHRRLNELVRQVQQRHPDSKYRPVPHPKEVGEGIVQRTDPAFGPSTVADYINGTTGFLAKKLGDPSARPSPKTVQEAADKITEASKYYGVDSSPKAVATLSAVVALGACFLPLLVALISLVIDKIRGTK